MAYHQRGDASPSFAQTGAEFQIDDSDEVFSYLDEDAVDLTSEVGGSDVYELRSPRGSFRRPVSASTMASFRHQKASYTLEEELAVRRKFDRKLVLFVALLFMLSFLDRSNIGNARIAGMNADLQTDPPRDDWYEWSLTAFYISYISFEWMSLLFKVVPAHILVSTVVFTWGLVASLQAIATSYPVLIALRALLGIGEAGFTGIPFYLSFFFKRDELAFRTAIFISAAPLATTFASTLAWIILQFGKLTPIAPWRLLFLIEGLPSVLAAVVAWSAIPDSPQTASYLTRREKRIAYLRLQPQASSTSSSASSKRPTTGFKFRDLLPLLRDPVPWLTALMFFLTNMAYSSLPVFLPKILRDMGHDILAAQALSAPPYLLSFITVLFTAHMSDRLRVRTTPIVFHALCSAAGYTVLALAEPLHLPPIIRYIAIYPAAMGFFNVVTLTVVWNINNQRSDTRQGGGFAMMQLIGQCGPLVGTRLYPSREAPYYSRGMQTCAGAMLAVALIALVLRMYMRRQNKKMDSLDESKFTSIPSGEEEGLVGGAGRRAPSDDDSFRYML